MHYNHLKYGINKNKKIIIEKPIISLTNYSTIQKAEDRMKEIDEDVPPVGFIDDGTQFEQELERKEEAERWFEQHNDQIIQEEW